MSFRVNEYNRIINPLIQFHWAGWQADSRTLSNQGWEISVSENVQRSSIRIALRHTGLRMEGISEHVSFNHMEHMQQGHTEFILRNVIFPVSLATELQIHIHETQFTDHFTPMAASPTFTSEKPKSLEDFCIFREDRSNDIIVEPRQVSSMLEEILKYQKPKQAELRERYLRDQARQELQQHTVKARILTLVA